METKRLAELSKRRKDEDVNRKKASAYHAKRPPKSPYVDAPVNRVDGEEPWTRIHE